MVHALGETYTLAPSGKPIALFFYPKSGSYGCTKEACQFRDALADKDLFKRSNIEVVGISSDSVDAQKTFVEKQKLTYPVLSDEKGEVRKAYSVGKGLFGLVETARVTFIIDSKGVVRDAHDTTLNYSAHVKFISKWLDKLEAEEKKAAEPTAEPDASAAAPTIAAVPEGEAIGELGKAAEAVQA
ncbi:AhpC-TSA-domain-containing protein [Epithele typhae]|uniref:AhpC-TSA-domain-containing protein n=1 Tax=Epithele typhae TaxID=378194 RepID=UPI0020076FCD|nr:AhpC-TSA-domain-containing protein [Epithele typhae]KAH9933122.1 AhpC-TSA-domain-containing protein [Epithele typhae]